MAEYNPNIYLTAPKVEWFFRHTAQIGGGNSISNQAYQKMDASTYKEYIESHKLWLAEMAVIKQTAHDQALVRRYMEDFKEVVMPTPPSMGSGSSTDPKNLSMASKTRKLPVRGDLALKSVMTVREAKAPTVSTKPERVELAAQKKELKKTTAQIKAEVIKAKIAQKSEIIAEKTKIATEVSKLSGQRRLWKLEEQSAKSAGVRAGAINKVSGDNVVSVQADDGWKVVSRKKGTNMVQTSKVTDHTDASTKLRRIDTYADPSVANAFIPGMSALRQPIAVQK